MSAPLAELLDTAVPLWMLYLCELDDTAFAERWRAWIQATQPQHGGPPATRVEPPLFKENIFFAGGKSGEQAEAFNAMAKAIAALAFVPGGVKLFGRHWEAKRE